MKSILLVLASLLFMECRGDIAIIAGSGNTRETSDSPSFPLSNYLTVGENGSSPVLFSPLQEGQVAAVAIDPYRGTVLYVGMDQNNHALLYRGSVSHSQLDPISVPVIDFTILNSAVFDSQGTAIVVGQTAHSSQLM